MQGRACAACGKPLGCIAIDGAYWHLPCFRKASPEKREAARKTLHREQQEEIAASERRAEVSRKHLSDSCESGTSSAEVPHGEEG